MVTLTAGTAGESGPFDDGGAHGTAGGGATAHDGGANKQAWRSRLLTARRTRTAAEIAAARERIGEHLVSFVAGLAGGNTDVPDRAASGLPASGSVATGPGASGRAASHLTGAYPMTVCLYLPLPSEPLPEDLPERLVADGVRCLLPVTVPGEALLWCDVADASPPGTQARPFRPGMLGVPEPTGPRLPAETIAEADVIVVPALAVDGSGVRLGRGGGFYDRSLALLADRTGPVSPALLAVIFDDEFVSVLPRDAHDVSVSHVVTPGGGVTRVARSGPDSAS